MDKFICFRLVCVFVCPVAMTYNMSPAVVSFSWTCFSCHFLRGKWAAKILGVAWLHWTGLSSSPSASPACNESNWVCSLTRQDGIRSSGSSANHLFNKISTPKSDPPHLDLLFGRIDRQRKRTLCHSASGRVEIRGTCWSSTLSK